MVLTEGKPREAVSRKALKSVWLTFLLFYYFIFYFIFIFFIFLFSIWRYLVHISAILIHYNSNMCGRHRRLLLFRQPIINMY